MAQKRTFVLLYFGPAPGEIEIETASPGVDLSWTERRSDAGTWSESVRTRKEESPSSERPAILAQAILPALVLASMFSVGCLKPYD